MWFYRDEKRKSIKITDFDVVEYHLSIRENLYKTYAAALCSELVIKTKNGHHQDDLQTLWVLVKGFLDDGHFGFEEMTYLLLFGGLPNEGELKVFTEMLAERRTLPPNFVRDVIMKAPSNDIMNSLTKSVLTLASYDDNVSDLSLDNVLRQSLMLISVFPMLSVYGYHAYNHYVKIKGLKMPFTEKIIKGRKPKVKEYSKLHQVFTYPAPKGAPLKNDYDVFAVPKTQNGISCSEP